MQVNDLIFKELIKRGYALEGKTRVWNIADSKLWYLSTDQAQAYLDLEKHKDYSKYMFETEIEMLHKHMPAIAEIILNSGKLNIIDIGCGDGKKAIPVIEELHSKAKLRYCPVDISSYMVTKAIEKISKLNKGEVVQFQWNISDFDNLENVASLLRNKDYRQNFLLFLGGTLGNFEMHEVMYEIMEAMDSSEDYLLIGVALTNAKPEDIIASYKQGLMDQFLVKVLTQIGFKRENLEFGVRYKNSRVEMYYTLLQDTTLQFGDRVITFMKGDQILVAVSYRYREQDLKKAIKLYFKDVKFYLNENKTWALVLCHK